MCRVVGGPPGRLATESDERKTVTATTTLRCVFEGVLQMRGVFFNSRDVI